MIIWIASYPKSGNTWVRFFLKSYFNNYYSNITLAPKIYDNFKIQNFPNIFFMKERNVNYLNFQEIVKNWKNMQDYINLNNKTNFLKTHNALCTIKNYPFTTSENTSGGIYVVRDPRDVVISYADHFGTSLEEAVDRILSSEHNENPIDENGKSFILSLMGSWADHYNSWKSYKKRKILIIKYEDLIDNTFKTFLKIIEYLNKIQKTPVDIDKIKYSIEEVKFENLKKMESKEGFVERGKGRAFFRIGKAGNWRKELETRLVKKIEEKFSKEMKDLGYL